MRLGQFDDWLVDDFAGFYDTGDYTTDIFSDAAVGVTGADEFYSYDFDTPQTIGYDVSDPLAGDAFFDDQYAPALTMPNDYGDLWNEAAWLEPGYDPASGIGTGDTAYAQDWAAWEDGGAADVAATFGGDAAAAITSFGTQFPEVNWDSILKSGQDIFKFYQSMQQPLGPGGKPYPKPSVMIDPKTGQPIAAVRDPRTGQLVPAKRDPRTGQLVPATQQAALIPGVSNLVLFAGIGAAAFFFITRRR